MLFLLVAAVAMAPDLATLNAAALQRWPRLEPAMEQQLVARRAELEDSARRAWAMDRALPMLAGEIRVPDAVLRDVLREAASALPARAGKDLVQMEHARRDYAKRALPQAAERYAKVRQQSPLWPEALRERAWSLLLLGRPDDALGATVSLLAPYFAPEDHAEGRLLKATVLLERCRYDEARAEVAPLADASPEQLTEMDARLALRTGKPPETRLGRLAWASPLVIRVREALMEAGNSAAGARLEATGVRLLMAAFAEEADSVRDARERALRIRYESFRQQRAWVEKNATLTEPKPSELTPLEDDEVEWTFDGTFWRDELGTYRYTAGSACPHEAEP